MIEAMLTGKRGLPPSTIPVLGYDFGKSLNTGSSTLTSTHTASNISNYGDSSAGYTRGLDLTNTQLTLGPVDALKFMETEDITLEFWIYIDTGSVGYTTFFQFTYDGNKTLPVRLGDGGFGSRLQFSFYAAVLGANWSSQYNRTTFQGGWRHVALVREAGKARFYVNGLQQSLASGTSSTYNVTSPDVSTYILKNITKLTFGGGTTRMYMPEFALWLGAKYSANFTPKKGSLLN
jgi:hypothetical protein